MTFVLPDILKDDEWFALTEWYPMAHQQSLYWGIVNAAAKPATAKRRFIALWHRRSGKDSTLINAMARAAMVRPGLYYYLAPSQKHGRKIIWDNVDRHGRRIINQAFPKKIRDSTNDQEMRIVINTPKGDSIFQIVGSDNYDSIVGTNPVGLAFSEWALAEKPEAWDYFRPILTENKGWAAFISTPRGLNHYYHMWRLAQSHKDWWSSRLTVNDTFREDNAPIVSEEDIENERAVGMSEDKIRQEFYCDFLAANDKQLFDMAAVKECYDRSSMVTDVSFNPGPTPLISLDTPIIMGVDVARYGDDKSRFVFRQGRVLGRYKVQTYHHIDLTQLAHFVRKAAELYKVDMIFIDETGVGGGLVDILKYDPTPSKGINFGSRAEDPNKYYNRRAEMYGRFAEWTTEPDSIIREAQDLMEEMQVIEYDYDPNSRMKLTDKAKMKKDLGVSPDYADAAALTFASHVHPRGQRRNKIIRANLSY